MEEVIKSIKAFLYDRTVSPLFGAFAVAWLGWNYRVVMAVLDGSASLAEKMSFLDGYFADDRLFQMAGLSFHVIGGGHLVNGLLMPAIFTFVYIYVYPKLAQPVYLSSLENLRNLRELKNKQDGLRLLTLDESRRLQKEIEQLRSKSEEEVANYRKRIESLVETINSLEDKKDSEFLSDDDLVEQRGGLFDSITGKPRTNDDDALRAKIEADKQEDSEAQNSAILELQRELALHPLTEDIVSDPDADELLTRAARYSLKNKLSIDMFLVLLVLALQDGVTNKPAILNILGNKLNRIELDHQLKKMTDRNLIISRGNDIILTDSGKEVAVESGITQIDRYLRKLG